MRESWTSSPSQSVSIGTCRCTTHRTLDRWSGRLCLRNHGRGLLVLHSGRLVVNDGRCHFASAERLATGMTDLLVHAAQEIERNVPRCAAAKRPGPTVSQRTRRCEPRSATVESRRSRHLWNPTRLHIKNNNHLVSLCTFNLSGAWEPSTTSSSLCICGEATVTRFHCFWPSNHGAWIWPSHPDHGRFAAPWLLISSIEVTRCEGFDLVALCGSSVEQCGMIAGTFKASLVRVKICCSSSSTSCAASQF